MSIQLHQWLLVTTVFFGTNFMAGNDLRSEENTKPPVADALVGLDGVLVKVDLPPDTATQLGVEKGALEDQIDRQLRAANIRNLSREQSVRQGAAELRVSIRATNVAESKLIAYRIDVAVREPAILVRDHNRTIATVTWQSPGVVAASTNPLTESVRRGIEQEVGKFIQTFLASNKRS